MFRASLRTLSCAMAVGALWMVPTSQAAVIYSTNGSTYSQDFNTLPTTPENTSLQTTIPWKDDDIITATQTSIPGWYLYHSLNPGTESGTNGHQRFRIGHGVETTGSFYSFGSTGNTDRALGDVGSTTIAQNPPGDQNVFIALRLNNGTSKTLTDFTITYTGEQWRNNGNAATDTVNFDYGFFQTAPNQTDGWNNVPSMAFTSPVATATASALDGNNPANRSTKTITINNVVWAPGSDLWLRWDDLQISGNDHALAIDDVSFTAFPEPASLSLVAGGLALLGIRRRSR